MHTRPKKEDVHERKGESSRKRDASLKRDRWNEKWDCQKKRCKREQKRTEREERAKVTVQTGVGTK